jgi:hypothetical protein
MLKFLCFLSSDSCNENPVACYRSDAVGSMHPKSFPTIFFSEGISLKTSGGFNSEVAILVLMRLLVRYQQKNT